MSGGNEILGSLVLSLRDKPEPEKNVCDTTPRGSLLLTPSAA
jgi:hypothetical protein